MNWVRKEELERWVYTVLPTYESSCYPMLQHYTMNQNFISAEIGYNGI